MARYNIGDKVKTTDAWDNGMGKVIPQGSIVEIKYDNGKMCRCSIKGVEAWYEYEWLGDVVENGIIGSKITNADKIRSMSDEELAEFIDKVSRTCLVDALGGKSECNTECKICKIKFGSILNWLQSEAE